MLPAAPVTVTRTGESGIGIHLLYDRIRELGGSDGTGVISGWLEVIGHLLARLDDGGDGALHSVGSVLLVEMPEHQDARQHERGRVDPVLPLVLGGRAVGGLEHGSRRADVPS